MIGHEGVVRGIVKLLKAKLPGVIHELEKDLKLRAGTISQIAADSIHPSWVDVVAKGKFPALMILQDDSETRNTGRQVGSSGEWDEYEWTYPIRMILHNVGAGAGETELERKRLMLAIRIVLLRHRGLITGDQEDAVIQAESLREMFNGGAIGEHEKLLLESTIQFNVRTNEIVTSWQGSLGTQSPQTSYGFI